jgi:hypothetical protein
VEQIEVVRQQWQEGTRRLDRARRDESLYATLVEQVELVTAELRRRVGQTFTLAELAREYRQSDEWARAILDDAIGEDGPPPDAATAADAAFYLYARGATDYAP